MEKIEKIIQLLKQHEEKPFVKEILFSFENEEVIFSGLTQLDLSEAINIYTTREEIQERGNNKETVQGFHLVLSSLRTSTVEGINIASITNENNVYVIFYDLDVLFGILKSSNSNLLKQKQLHEVYLSKGFNSPNYRYLNGVRIQ